VLLVVSTSFLFSVLMVLRRSAATPDILSILNGMSFPLSKKGKLDPDLQLFCPHTIVSNAAVADWIFESC